MRKQTDKAKTNKKLLRDIYGEIPLRPVHLDYKNEYFNENYAAGKAIFIEKKIILDLGEKNAELVVKMIMPKGNLPCPTIIYLSDEEHIPNRFLPVEEIIDRGYGIISICADDIAENKPYIRREGIHRQKNRREQRNRRRTHKHNEYAVCKEFLLVATFVRRLSKYSLAHAKRRYGNYEITKISYKVCRTVLCICEAGRVERQHKYHDKFGDKLTHGENRRV